MLAHFCTQPCERMQDPSWRRHSERLHLHTIDCFSALPLRRAGRGGMPWVIHDVQKKRVTDQGDLVGSTG